MALQRLAGNAAVAGVLGRAGSAPEPAPAAPVPATSPDLALHAATGGGAATGGPAGGGNGSGGGPVAPSTFAAGVSGFAALVGSSTAQAAASGAAVLAAPAAIRGPDPAEPPVLPEPSPPAAVPAAPTPAPPTGGDGGLDVAATTDGIAGHTTVVATGVDAAAAGATAAATAIASPVVGASRAPSPVALPAAPATPEVPAPVTAGLPTLEPEVARVLDGGFGSRLAARAEAARAEHAEAVGRHGAQVEAARGAHESAVTQHQAAADRDTAAVRTAADRQVTAAKSAWSAESGSAGAEARSQLGAARAATAADVAGHAGRSNAEAARIVQDGQTQARSAQAQAGAQPEAGVQRSLWDSAKKAAGGLVSAAKDGLSSLAGAARGLLDAALTRAKSVLDAARTAIGDRVARFTEVARAVAERVRTRLAQAAGTAVGAIRSAVAAARSALDGVVARVRAVGARLVAGLIDGVRRAGAWLAEKGKAIIGGLVAAGKAVLDLAGKVRQLLAVTGNKVLTGVVRIIEDPSAFVRPYIAEVGKMIAAVPGKAAGLYDQHIAPLFGGGGAPAVTSAVQRQPDGDATTTLSPGSPIPAGPTRGAIVKSYLGQRLTYLAGNWGSVILNALLEIFVPFVSVYRHLPAAMKAAWQALKDLWAGNVSDAIDNGLKAAREMMAILGSLFALFSIVAWIAGSIFGTPIIGEAAMFAIGMSVLAADLVLQLASIHAAGANLDKPGRTVAQMDDDFNVMADSIFSLAITVALIIIAVVGQKIGKVLLARFPRVAGALEGIMSRLRRAARGNQPVVDVPTAKPVAPPATEFPGRAGLTPGEQAAFDRFIASQRANNKLTPEFEKKLMSSTPDQLRKIAAKEIAAQPKAEADQAKADRAKATNASDPYDPVMANTEDQGGNVKIRWNEVRPTDGEIAQAKQLAAQTGEPVELYGDGYRGIDGNINKRPLQIKSIPDGPPPMQGPAGVRRSAEIARAKAIRDGFGNVEVQLEAQGMTRQQVAAAFTDPKANGVYLDGTGASKVVVHCSDGVYAPPPQGRPATPLPGPIHVDDDKAGDRQKADAGTRE